MQWEVLAELGSVECPQSHVSENSPWLKKKATMNQPNKTDWRGMQSSSKTEVIQKVWNKRQEMCKRDKTIVVKGS